MKRLKLNLLSAAETVSSISAQLKLKYGSTMVDLHLTKLLRCLGDEVLLQQTLFDAVVTAPLEAYWNALMLNDR